MYSINARLHYIAFQSLIILAGLAVLCHLTGRYLLFKPDIKADFTVHSFPFFYHETKRTYYTPNWDYLQASFSLDIKQVQTYNNWNLKQMFIFLDATFEGQYGNNTQIVWDRIVKRDDYSLPSTISITRQNLKYPIRDVYKQLANKDIKIRLWIEFMPIFGVITRVN